MDKQKINTPQLSISLVTYNSLKDLPDFFKSLEYQTYKNFEMIIVDNASTDGTGEYLKKNLLSKNIVLNGSNEGYAKAHNIGISMASSPYILIANPDIRLDRNYLQEIINSIESNGRISSVGGKLYKFNMDLNNPQMSDMLDSTGFMCFKNRRVVDRGEGAVDDGSYDVNTEVFGASGALVLFKKEALDDIRLPNGQYFDESYFMYQEDVDVAWRLQLRGWKCLFNPKAIAWHRRSAQANSQTGSIKQLLNRRKKSSLMNKYSYRNHLLTLIKNETAANLLLYAPWIVWYELRKFIYILLFEPRSLIFSLNIWKNISENMKLRKYIQSRIISQNKDIRKWFQ